MPTQDSSTGQCAEADGGLAERAMPEGVTGRCQNPPRNPRGRISKLRGFPLGGWSVRGAAVHDYIDATCPDTPAARRFFGWLAVARH